MTTTSPKSAFEVLEREECLALLATVPVGRIVYTERALPAVRPVTFLVDGDSVVVRTGYGSRLAAVALETVVAFEVDDIEPALRWGWSVVVTGLASRITDAGELERLRERLQPWAPGTRECFLRISISLVNGRRIGPRVGGPDASRA